MTHEQKKTKGTVEFTKEELEAAVAHYFEAERRRARRGGGGQYRITVHDNGGFEAGGHVQGTGDTWPEALVACWRSPAIGPPPSS